MKNLIKIVLAILLILVIMSCGKKEQSGYMDPNNTLAYITVYIDSSKVDYFLDIVKSINNGEEEYKYANISITEDLDLTSTGFEGIGTEIHPFEGSINGNGNKVNISGNTCLGFIAYLRNGSVKNLAVEGQINIGIHTLLGSKHGIGGLVGYAENSRIENCLNNTKVIVKGGNAGDRYVGGLVGYAENSRIENCVNNAEVIVKGRNAGNRYVGGIVGYFKVTRNREGNSIAFCVNNSTGIENGTEKIGGIAALIEGGIQTSKGTTIGSTSPGFTPEVGTWKD